MFAVVAACSGGGHAASDTSSSGSKSAGSFCDAYARFLDAGKMPSSTPDEVRAALAELQAVMNDEAAAAPAAIAADVAQVRTSVQRAIAIIDRYGDDIDAALLSASGDDAKVLDQLAGSAGPDSPDGHIRTFARSACPDVAVPADDKFSSVSPTVN